MANVIVSPELSIIVVTWNGKRYALECLESLHSHPADVPTEIIVVDNASSDGTPEAIRSRFPDVNVVENRANLGFAKANNIGLKISRGQYICLINSDVVVYPSCLQNMLLLMQNNRNIAVIGPKMRCPDGAVGLSVMKLPTVWNTFCAALALNTLFPHSKLFASFSMRSDAIWTINDVQVVTGWFWMISRAALDQVGELDERFFMYGEDIDWCHRFLSAGWRIVFCGNAESLHYGGASSADAPERSYVEMRSANLLYFHKHHGALGAFGYRLAISVHEIARIVGYSVSYCFTRHRRPEASSKIRRSVSSLLWLIDKSALITRQVDR